MGYKVKVEFGPLRLYSPFKYYMVPVRKHNVSQFHCCLWLLYSSHCWSLVDDFFGHVGHPTVFLSGSEQSSHTSSQFSTCATPYVNTEPHVRRHSCRQPVKGGANSLCHIHYRGSVKWKPPYTGYAILSCFTVWQFSVFVWFGNLLVI